MNKLMVILWKISSTFTLSTAANPSMCFGRSFNGISTRTEENWGYVMQWEHAHLAPIQVQSQVFYNIIKQTAETVGHKDKYLLRYRILSEGMCSCCLLVGLSRNWRYIGSEIPASFSGAEFPPSASVWNHSLCALSLALFKPFCFTSLSNLSCGQGT